jgi:hypothetical protein
MLVLQRTVIKWILLNKESSDINIECFNKQYEIDAYSIHL